MFIDLNLPVDDTENNSSTRSLLSDTTNKRIDTLVRLGYDGVALNHVVSSKLTQKHMGPTTALAERPTQTAFLQATGKTAFHHFQRLTVVVDGPTNGQQMTSTNPILASYDCVAVKVDNEKLFQAACNTYEVDIISLDLSERLSFVLKFGPVNVAIQRGIFFEIAYSKAIKSSAARRNLICNAINLVRVTKGRNLLLTSEAEMALDLRGPYDVINLASLFGLNQGDAKHALSTNARAVLFHAETRRNTFRAAMSLSDRLAVTAKPSQTPEPSKKKQKLVPGTELDDKQPPSSSSPLLPSTSSPVVVASLTAQLSPSPPTAGASRKKRKDPPQEQPADNNEQ